MNNIINNPHQASKMTPEELPFISANPAALQFCWHIRVGMFRDIQPEKMKTYADFFYRTYLDPHLCAQEQLILASPALPALLVKKVMTSHRRLRRLFEYHGELYRVLSKIEDTLEEHVRLEQRVLFRALQAVCREIGGDISQLGQQFYDPALAEKLSAWQDRYWALE
jgi:hypothetical protein